MTTYDLNKKWYTTTPTSSEELDKLLLILNVYGFYTNIEKLDPHYHWLGSGSIKKQLNRYSENVKATDFKNAGYLHIPLEYLLSL